MTTIKGFLTNLSKYNKGALVGEWVTFPLYGEDMQEVFECLGLKDDDEYFFTDWEADGLESYFGEYEDIDNLNEIAEEIESLSTYELNKLQQVAEYEGDGNLSDLLDLLSELDDYTFIDGIFDDEDLGCYYVDEFDLLNDAPDALVTYFNYEMYGHDIRMEQGGSYCSGGYVASSF